MLAISSWCSGSVASLSFCKGGYFCLRREVSGGRETDWENMCGARHTRAGPLGVWPLTQFIHWCNSCSLIAREKFLAVLLCWKFCLAKKLWLKCSHGQWLTRFGVPKWWCPLHLPDNLGRFHACFNDGLYRSLEEVC